MGDFLQYMQTILLGMRQKLLAGAADLSILYQLSCVVLAFLGMFLLGGFLRRLMARILANIFPGEKQHLPQIKAKVVEVAAPLFAALILSIITLVAQHEHWSHRIIYAATDLLWAWVIIRLLTGLLISSAWSKPFAVLIMTVATMDIVGVLDPTITVLDRIGFNLGDGRLSMWVIIKTAVMLALLLPLSNWLCHIFQHRIEQVANLSPRVRVLLLKLTKTAIYTLSIIIALRSVGFDFHLLAVFSGAVGLGVGFGLQKVVSNLVSGVIILMDNSIRPGDVIEVGGVFGWIESLHSRFISMITRDGTSYLIPNDELITNKVINWSFSGRGIRLKIPVGISYTSNVHEAMALMVAATGEFPRILTQPKPVARLVSFGDSAINLDLRIWIKDPENGVTNIKSSVQLKIWDLFKANGIEFPFPQHDLHIKTPSELTVRIKDRLA